MGNFGPPMRSVKVEQSPEATAASRRAKIMAAGAAAASPASESPEAIAAARRAKIMSIGSMAPSSDSESPEAIAAARRAKIMSIGSMAASSDSESPEAIAAARRARIMAVGSVSSIGPSEAEKAEALAAARRAKVLGAGTAKPNPHGSSNGNPIVAPTGTISVPAVADTAPSFAASQGTTTLASAGILPDRASGPVGDSTVRVQSWNGDMKQSTAVGDSHSDDGGESVTAVKSLTGLNSDLLLPGEASASLTHTHSRVTLATQRVTLFEYYFSQATSSSSFSIYMQFLPLLLPVLCSQLHRFQLATAQSSAARSCPV